jgi:hypothetical protein
MLREKENHPTKNIKYKIKNIDNKMKKFISKVLLEAIEKEFYGIAKFIFSL